MFDGLITTLRRIFSVPLIKKGEHVLATTCPSLGKSHSPYKVYIGTLKSGLYPDSTAITILTEEQEVTFSITAIDVNTVRPESVISRTIAHRCTLNSGSNKGKDKVLMVIVDSYNIHKRLTAASHAEILRFIFR